ncbi:carbohydrate esterase family 4 protein [Pterulicium gracile]|uniref:Carbohydrate esterase family 4 protein n=1 Tax=Pterulicium gracile TaxID=1884261 RepID=A0A5C3Q1E2_9AGAR|nr:carbohydrate esterase family 4 protein [Pterula gracilis]
MRFTLITSLVASVVLLQGAIAAPHNPLAQVVTKCKKNNTVALTFDDGPYEYAYDLSKALVAAGGKGTFFLNGNNYECIYSDDNVKRIHYLHEQGHQLASHTWNHKHLNTLKRHDLEFELGSVSDALERIAGLRPAFMRPPFGEYNNLVREVAASIGETVVIWDFDSTDSIGATPEESKALYDKTISEKPKSILALNHEVYRTSVQDVLPYAISKLTEAGYELVTLAECLGEEPYQNVGKPGKKDGMWKC